MKHLYLDVAEVSIEDARKRWVEMKGNIIRIEIYLIYIFWNRSIRDGTAVLVIY